MAHSWPSRTEEGLAIRTRPWVSPASGRPKCHSTSESWRTSGSGRSSRSRYVRCCGQESAYGDFSLGRFVWTYVHVVRTSVEVSVTQLVTVVVTGVGAVTVVSALRRVVELVIHLTGSESLTMTTEGLHPAILPIGLHGLDFGHHWDSQPCGTECLWGCEVSFWSDGLLAEGPAEGRIAIDFWVGP